MHQALVQKKKKKKKLKRKTRGRECDPNGTLLKNL